MADTAVVLWERAVLWKKPGGSHYVKFLKRGDKLTILQGTRYKEREWKDKRFLKVCHGSAVGFVLVNAISTIKFGDDSDENEGKGKSSSNSLVENS